VLEPIPVCKGTNLCLKAFLLLFKEKSNKYNTDSTGAPKWVASALNKEMAKSEGAVYDFYCLAG